MAESLSSVDAGAPAANEIQVVDVTENSDLTVRVTLFDKPLEGERTYGVADPMIVKIIDLRVERAAIAALSPFFSTLLTTTQFLEASKEIIELKEVNPELVYIVFRNAHQLPVDTARTASLTVGDIYDLLAILEQYDIEPTTLRKWFNQWLTSLAEPGSSAIASSLLFPCFAFRHCKGFLEASRTVVYDLPGHVQEAYRTSHKNLHLPQRVVQQLNAAKGRLRTILHGEIYRPIKLLVDKGACECRAQTLLKYHKALHQTKAWPIEGIFQNASVNDICDQLREFEYTKDDNACLDVCHHFNSDVVYSAIEKVEDYFGGLCLDCMTYSKGENTDEDYWNHSKIGQWSYGCSIRHGQPTWYFSFMGRKETRIAHTKKRSRRDS